MEGTAEERTALGALAFAGPVGVSARAVHVRPFALRHNSYADYFYTCKPLPRTLAPQYIERRHRTHKVLRFNRDAEDLLAIGKYEDAERALRKAHKHALRSRDVSTAEESSVLAPILELAVTLNNLGCLEFGRGNQQRALLYFEACQRVEESHELRSALTYLNLSIAFLAAKFYRNAVTSATHAMSLATDMDEPAALALLVQYQLVKAETESFIKTRAALGVLNRSDLVTEATILLQSWRRVVETSNSVADEGITVFLVEERKRAIETLEKYGALEPQTPVAQRDLGSGRRRIASFVGLEGPERAGVPALPPLPRADSKLPSLPTPPSRANIPIAMPSKSPGKIPTAPPVEPSNVSRMKRVASLPPLARREKLDAAASISPTLRRRRSERDIGCEPDSPVLVRRRSLLQPGFFLDYFGGDEGEIKATSEYPAHSPLRASNHLLALTPNSSGSTSGSSTPIIHLLRPSRYGLEVLVEVAGPGCRALDAIQCPCQSPPHATARTPPDEPSPSERAAVPSAPHPPCRPPSGHHQFRRSFSTSTDRFHEFDDEKPLPQRGDESRSHSPLLWSGSHSTDPLEVRYVKSITDEDVIFASKANAALSVPFLGWRNPLIAVENCACPAIGLITSDWYDAAGDLQLGLADAAAVAQRQSQLTAALLLYLRNGETIISSTKLEAAVAEDPARAAAVAERARAVASALWKMLCEDGDPSTASSSGAVSEEHEHTNVDLLRLTIAMLSPLIDVAGIVESEGLIAAACASGAYRFVNEFLRVPLVRMRAPELLHVFEGLATTSRPRCTWRAMLRCVEAVLAATDVVSELAECARSVAPSAIRLLSRLVEQGGGDADAVALFQAIAANRHLAPHIDFGAALENGHTLFSLACVRGCLEMVRTMWFDCGRVVSQFVAKPSPRFGPPLHNAVASGNLAVVELVLQHPLARSGINDEWKGQTSLELAASLHADDLVAAIRQRGGRARQPAKQHSLTVPVEVASRSESAPDTTELEIETWLRQRPTSVASAGPADIAESANGPASSGGEVEATPHMQPSIDDILRDDEGEWWAPLHDDPDAALPADSTAITRPVLTATIDDIFGSSGSDFGGALVVEQQARTPLAPEMKPNIDDLFTPDAQGMAPTHSDSESLSFELEPEG